MKASETKLKPARPSTGLPRGALACASLASGETSSFQDKCATVVQMAPNTSRAFGKRAGGGKREVETGRDRGGNKVCERIRVGTVNVGSMSRRSGEVIEMAKNRRLDFCCLQETRWKGSNARSMGGYKFFWKGCEGGVSGVGVLVAEKWVSNVIEIRRVSERMMLVRVRVGTTILNLVSVYAPQVGKAMEEKEEFYVMLGKLMKETSVSEVVMVCGDLNGHVGEKSDGYWGVHGGKGFGSRNLEGEMLLEFAEAEEMAIMNTWFDKQEVKKVTYESGGCRTVVDYVLIKQRDRLMVTDVAVIANEPCITQHKLMVCKLVLSEKVKNKKDVYVSRCRVWKLREMEVLKDFKSRVHVIEESRNRLESSVDVVWGGLKKCLLEVSDAVCGRTKGPPRHEVSWWWNEECAKAVALKKRWYGAMKNSGRGVDKGKASSDKQMYNEAKMEAKKVISRQKEAERKKFGESLDREEERGNVFNMVKKMVRRNRDVVGGGCMKNCDGKIVVEEEEIKEVWRSYYEKLLNEEFEWDHQDIVEDKKCVGVDEVIVIQEQEVRDAIGRMKIEKAAGPTGVVAEMLKAAGDEGVRWMTDLCNVIVREGKVPADWSKSWMVSIYKGKGDALQCGSYRGIKLLEHAMKVFERVVEKRLRGVVQIDDMQFGFRPGVGTTDAIFIVRQLQEKYLHGKKELWMAFVDLEKAFDRVPREVLWWALRELEVDEGLVAVIKAMYEGARTAVKVKGGESQSFEVKVGVHQGSVLSPLLFIIVLEALTKRFRMGLPYELLYADDLVLIAESELELLNRLNVWKESLEVKGLRINMGKTKVMVCQAKSGQVMDSGRWPCAICKKGVGSNSIQCSKCKKWIHKKCSGLKKKLKQDSQFQCLGCINDNIPKAGVDKKKEIVMKDGSRMESVDSFCYLGDMMGAAGGAEEASRTRVRCAWGKFNELGCILAERGASLKLKGKIYSLCVQRVLVYGSETWPVKVEDMRRLERTEKSMVRRMCGVSLKNKCRSEELKDRLGIEGVADVVRRGRLRWFGHVERKEEKDWVSGCREVKVEVVGGRGRGRGRKTWKEVVEEDLKRDGLSREMAQDRDLWRRLTHGKTSNLRKRGK